MWRIEEEMSMKMKVCNVLTGLESLHRNSNGQSRSRRVELYLHAQLTRQILNPFFLSLSSLLQTPTAIPKRLKRQFLKRIFLFFLLFFIYLEIIIECDWGHGWSHQIFWFFAFWHWHVSWLIGWILL